MICECGNELTENDVLDMCGKCLSKFVGLIDRGGNVDDKVEENNKNNGKLGMR